MQCDCDYDSVNIFWYSCTLCRGEDPFIFLNIFSLHKMFGFVPSRQATYWGSTVFLGLPNFSGLGSRAEQSTKKGACVSISSVQSDGSKALYKARSGI